MNRSTTAAVLAPLMLLAACEVTDNNNGSSTISLDENRIEQGADVVANQAEKAGAKAANAPSRMHTACWRTSAVAIRRCPNCPSPRFPNSSALLSIA